jgi:protease-4
MADEQEQTQQAGAQDLDEIERSLQVAWWWIVLAVVIIAGAVVGILLSQAVAPQPKIAIIRLYDIISYSTSPYYLGPLQDAAERKDVAAVVILVDSPGGDATVSEDLFYTVLALRDDKPVVASVERFAASGAYYVASATNYIYARPAAQVGSIGVIAEFPKEYGPDDEVLTTGPFKQSGSSQVDFVRDVEAVKETFLTHVYDQRVYTLEHMHPESRRDLLPERDLIATGQIWSGVRAYDIGLVDALGSNRDAIEKAAELAGVVNYDVIDLLAVFLDLNEEFEGYSADDAPDWYEVGPWAELYHLYVMPED